MPTPEADIEADVRVWVGRMGAGKTRCLVELRRRLEQEGTYDLARIDFDLPSLTHVTRLAEDLALDPVERGEIWGQIWKRAIMRSTLSHALRGARGHDDVTARLQQISPPLTPPVPGIPRTIYADFDRMLREHPNPVDLRRFLADARWEEVEYCFEQVLERRDTPLCFFLDTGEEESAHAPRYWLWCQLGLVREVLHLAQDEQMANKLRIFVAIRDQTFAELLKATRVTRFEQHPKVRQLRWGPRAASEFLAKKIGQLKPDYLLGDRPDDCTDAGALVAAWLGTDQMRNGARNGDEAMTTYLLRHTRLIPRDIVSLGNSLAREVNATRGKAHEVPSKRISTAVAESARLSATEELQACAVEVIAQQLDGVRSAYQRREIVQDEDAPGRTLTAVMTLLRRGEQDVVPRDAMDRIDDAAREHFHTDVALADMLWRRGLVGWSEDLGGPYEFGPGGSVSLPARRRARYVAFHPCIVALLGLEPAADHPVVPFEETEL